MRWTSSWASMSASSRYHEFVSDLEDIKGGLKALTRLFGVALLFTYLPCFLLVIIPYYANDIPGYVHGRNPYELTGFDFHRWPPFSWGIIPDWLLDLTALNYWIGFALGFSIVFLLLFTLTCVWKAFRRWERTFWAGAIVGWFLYIALLLNGGGLLNLWYFD